MTNEEMSTYLSKAVSKYALMIGVSVTENITKKLPVSSEYRIVTAKEEDSFLNARNALIASGKVLLEDREASRIEGIVYAGAANMNPAILVAYVDGDQISIAAYAKEGLIKQHTAKKAIALFEEAL